MSLICSDEWSNFGAWTLKVYSLECTVCFLYDKQHFIWYGYQDEKPTPVAIAKIIALSWNSQSWDGNKNKFNLIVITTFEILQSINEELNVINNKTTIKTHNFNTTVVTSCVLTNFELLNSSFWNDWTITAHNDRVRLY